MIARASAEVRQENLDRRLGLIRRNLIAAMREADEAGDSTTHFHLTQAAACLDNAESR